MDRGGSEYVFGGSCDSEKAVVVVRKKTKYVKGIPKGFLGFDRSKVEGLKSKRRFWFLLCPLKIIKPIYIHKGYIS